MELKMESFQKLNSVMSIQHHLIEQKRVLIPIACTMEAIDINNNSKLPKVWILEFWKLFSQKSKFFEFGNIFETICWDFEPPTHCVGGDIVKNLIGPHLIGNKRHPTYGFKYLIPLTCLKSTFLFSSAVTESFTIRNTSLYTSWASSRQTRIWNTDTCRANGSNLQCNPTRIRLIQSKSSSLIFSFNDYIIA